MSERPTCPACHGGGLHPVPQVIDADDRKAANCPVCDWFYWSDDTAGCNRCRLHWPGGRPNRRGYTVPRAALLLAVSRQEVESLLRDNPALQRNERSALPLLQRMPLHAMAALFT